VSAGAHRADTPSLFEFRPPARKTGTSFWAIRTQLQTAKGESNNRIENGEKSLTTSVAPTEDGKNAASKAIDFKILFNADSLCLC
jgi:hypothetical protein